jgi:hypothetical protein
LAVTSFSHPVKWTKQLGQGRFRHTGTVVPHLDDRIRLILFVYLQQLYFNRTPLLRITYSISHHVFKGTAQ